MAELYKAEKPEKDRLIEPAVNTSGQLSVFEKKMLQVQEEADAIRKEAQRVAEKFISNAKSEADEIRQTAYNEGLEKGKSESIARIGDLSESLAQELERVQNAHSELIKRAKSGIIQFSLKLAKLIIGEELKQSPALIETQLERIVERLSIEEKIEITISPDDFETIETLMNESGNRLAPEGYELKVDQALERGSVKVITSAMGIDGSLEGMMGRIESVVRSLLNDDE